MVTMRKSRTLLSISVAIFCFSAHEESVMAFSNMAQIRHHSMGCCVFNLALFKQQSSNNLEQNQLQSYKYTMKLTVNNSTFLLPVSYVKSKPNTCN